MARKKQLNIVHSSCHHGNGEGSSNGQSLPQVEPPQPYEDEVIHVEQQDDEPLNMPVVKCNRLGQPIGEEGGLLGQFLGTLARNGAYCPLDKMTWRNIKANEGDLTILQFVQTKFLYPLSCVQWILKSIGRGWRRYKAALKNKYFNPKKKRSALYKLCLDDVEKDQWIPLIKYWKSKKGKALSEKNKRSRSMLQNPHSAGTKSYARWSEDMRQDDPNKKQPHRAKVYLATHKQKDKAKNQHVVTSQRTFDDGIEEGVVRTNRKNKRRCEEKRNMQHDNILDLYGKKHQEADNTKGSPYQDDSSSQPHLAHDLRREMNKKKHRNLEKIAKTTEKQDTQKKIAHHMVQNRVHSSSIKVGTTIILITAKYPNKETVAYATYLRSNPRDKVDGVEIGNEFTKVVVNHPLKEDEELVRPVKHCSKDQ
uniref:Transposase Tnp1/En/Spm-like domain-containing protein n=1 Tax=Oryza brachyantha TaxID=4533 RepID=J3N1J8_ORYBR